MSYRDMLLLELNVVMELVELGEGDRSGPANKIKGLGELMFLVNAFLSFLALDGAR